MGRAAPGRPRGSGVDVRVREAGAAVAVALLLAACGSGADQPAASSSATSATPAASSPKPAPTSASPSASPVDTATPDPSMSPSSSPSAPLVPLTGYGAVLSVWAARHVADERFDPGAMWDPTPGIGPDEANNSRYNNLDASSGRVLAYTVYTARGGVTEAKATAAASTSLPKDATVVWKQQFPACSVVQLTSRSLAKAVAGKPFSNPQGQVQLILRSGSPVASSAVTKLDPAKVTYVQVRPTIAASPQDFTGC